MKSQRINLTARVLRARGWALTHDTEISAWMLVSPEDEKFEVYAENEEHAWLLFFTEQWDTDDAEVPYYGRDLGQALNLLEGMSQFQKMELAEYICKKWLESNT